MAAAATGEGCGDVEKERDKEEDRRGAGEEEDESEAEEEQELERRERVEGVRAGESNSDTRELERAMGGSQKVVGEGKLPGVEAGTVDAAETVCKHV